MSSRRLINASPAHSPPAVIKNRAREGVMLKHNLRAISAETPPPWGATILRCRQIPAATFRRAANRPAGGHLQRGVALARSPCHAQGRRFLRTAVTTPRLSKKTTSSEKRTKHVWIAPQGTSSRPASAGSGRWNCSPMARAQSPSAIVSRATTVLPVVSLTNRHVPAILEVTLAIYRPEDQGRTADNRG